MKSSTKDFLKEGKSLPGYSLFDRLHGYVYARWPYFYIGVAIGEHPLSRIILPFLAWIGKKKPLYRDSTETRSSFADTYHGKVVPLGEAGQLVTVNQDIQLPDLEHVIPYAKARDIILRNPDHITVLECPCRSSRKKPCLPLDVCLIIGEPFASFMAQHHPRRARRISQAEALEILREEDARGHVHHAFFKDAMLNRFYAICNCCSCCCGAMQAHRHGTPMLASSGYVVALDRAKCKACGECVKYCQFNALSVKKGRKEVDLAACMGCGVCVDKCPRGAISLQRDPARGTPLVLRDLVEAK